VYPAEVVDNFMTECTTRSDARVCRCALDALERRFTLQQFLDFEARLRAGECRRRWSTRRDCRADSLSPPSGTGRDTRSRTPSTEKRRPSPRPAESAPRRDHLDAVRRLLEPRRAPSTRARSTKRAGDSDVRVNTRRSSARSCHLGASTARRVALEVIGDHV